VPDDKQPFSFDREHIQMSERDLLLRLLFTVEEMEKQVEMQGRHLEATDERVEALRLWKAEVMGYSAAISLVIAVAVHLLWK
jgi:hypothetical protein